MGHLMSPSVRGDPAAQGYRAGAPAGKAPRPRAAAASAPARSGCSVGERRERSEQASSIEQGEKEQAWVGAPWLPNASKQETPGATSCTGAAGPELPRGEGPGGLDPSNKKNRGTWRSPRLKSRSGPNQSSEKRGRPAKPNTKRISEKIGQKQISSLPPRGV